MEVSTRHYGAVLETEDGQVEVSTRHYGAVLETEDGQMEVSTRPYSVRDRGWSGGG